MPWVFGWEGFGWVGFQPTDRISRRISRTLVQGGCALCPGRCAVPGAVPRSHLGSCSVRGKVRVTHWRFLSAPGVK